MATRSKKASIKSEPAKTTTAKKEPKSPEQSSALAVAAAPAESKGENLGNQLAAIRDLLHGEELRTINSDIVKLTDDMNNRLQHMSDHFEQALSKLSTDFSSKLEDLGKHLESLNKQHHHREDDLSSDIDDLRHRLEQAQQESNQADSELHDELQSEADRLMRELNQRHDKAMAELEKTSQDLSSNKADRKTLANLLASMANNLTADELK